MGLPIQQKSRVFRYEACTYAEKMLHADLKLCLKKIWMSLRHDMFQNEMFSRVFAFKMCIYFLNKYTLCFFTTTTCTKFPPVLQCIPKKIEPSTFRNSFNSLSHPHQPPSLPTSFLGTESKVSFLSKSISVMHHPYSILYNLSSNLFVWVLLLPLEHLCLLALCLLNRQLIN